MNLAIRFLKEFQHLHLGVGDTKVISFILDTMNWAATSPDGKAQKLLRTYIISVGGSQSHDAIFDGGVETYDLNK